MIIHALAGPFFSKSLKASAVKRCIGVRVGWEKCNSYNFLGKKLGNCYDFSLSGGGALSRFKWAAAGAAV